MSKITTVLLCLQPLLSASLFRQLTIISEALLMMQGRVTMLGISRWTRRGGSYRTIQRFFLSKINWETLHWTLIKPRLTASSGAILIAGDATTVTKSGQQTFGLGRFFSSIYARAVPGIAFQTLALIDVNQRRSWPVLLEQIAPKPPAPKKQSAKQKSPAGQLPKRFRGRPKSSKNKNQRNVKLNDEMSQVKAMLKRAAIDLVGRHPGTSLLRV